MKPDTGGTSAEGNGAKLRQKMQTFLKGKLGTIKDNLIRKGFLNSDGNVNYTELGKFQVKEVPEATIREILGDQYQPLMDHLRANGLFPGRKETFDAIMDLTFH
jgi:hypothetical protein